MRYTVPESNNRRYVSEASKRFSRCVASLLASGRGPTTLYELGEALGEFMPAASIRTSTLAHVIKERVPFPSKYGIPIAEVYGLSGEELIAFHRLRIAAELYDADVDMFPVVFGVEVEELIFPATPKPAQADDGVDGDAEVGGAGEEEVAGVTDDGEDGDAVPAPADAVKDGGVVVEDSEAATSDQEPADWPGADEQTTPMAEAVG